MGWEPVAPLFIAGHHPLFSKTAAWLLQSATVPPASYLLLLSNTPFRQGPCGLQALASE